MEVYKIVEKNGDLYKTLFHGLNHSRILPLNMWLKAKKKMVKDGSGGKTYLSGFHVFKKHKDAVNYLSRFALRHLIIIKCKANGLRQKPTNENIYLADEIKIEEQ